MHGPWTKSWRMSHRNSQFITIFCVSVFNTFCCRNYRLSCFAFFLVLLPPRRTPSLFFMIIEWLEINCAPSSSRENNNRRRSGHWGNVSSSAELGQAWEERKYIKLLQVAMEMKRLRNSINCKKIQMNRICRTRTDFRLKVRTFVRRP